MERFEIIHKHKQFTIEYDKRTYTYVIFDNLGVFKQQISKNYRYLGNCIKKFNEIVF